MTEINYSKLRSLTARRLISALIKDGFHLDRESGSHQQYLHPNKGRVTVSFHHPSDTFPPKTLKKIVQEAGMNLGLTKEQEMVRETARAPVDGDQYLVNGSKCFITNGGGADIYIVFARTDPAESPMGISVLIIEKDTPGFSLGTEEDKFGLRADPTRELVFENCRIPRGNLLGSQLAIDVTGKAIKLHGGYGCTKDFPVERYFRDAKTLSLQPPSDFVRANVGKILLGIPMGPPVKAEEPPGRPQ